MKPGNFYSKTITTDEKFKPCPVDKGDELFRNDIVAVNKTKMVEYIKGHPKEFSPEEISPEQNYGEVRIKNESHIGRGWGPDIAQ